MSSRRPVPRRGLLLRVVALVALIVFPAACRLPSSGGTATIPATTSHESATPTDLAKTAATVPTASTPSALVAPQAAATPGATGAQTLTLVGPQGGPVTLDPALTQDADSAFVVRQIFRGLVRLDAQLKPVPDLAQRIDVSPDGRTYTFHLFSHITFDNGNEITANDVKYSLDRATDPSLVGGDTNDLPAQTFLSDIAGAAERMAGKATTISGVQVIDTLTLRIQLVSPAADFLLKLAGTPAYVVDRQNVASGSNWWRQPNGSGPFALSEWKDGDRVVLKAHPGYEPNPPTLQTVVLLIGSNALDPVNLYESGTIDVVDLPTDALDRVQEPNSPYRGQLTVVPMLSASYVLLNPNVPPLNNPQVRRALVEAFPRAKVATVTFDGHVKPLDGILPDGLLGRTWPATPLPYDLATARTLLAQAGGLPNGITIYTTGNPAPVAMKQVYEQDLKVSVDVLQLEWTDFLQAMTQRALPALSLSWVADYPDPESFLRSLFDSQSPSNYIGYNNPEVDRLLDAAAVEQDPVQRAALYEQAQQKVIDDAVVIPLYTDVSYTLIRPSIHGVSVTPLGILGLETVWVTR